MSPVKHSINNIKKLEYFALRVCTDYSTVGHSPLFLYYELLISCTHTIIQFLVQLWTMSNYHWYLKMELNFANTAKGIAAILWDPVSQLKLHLITQGQWIILEYNPWLIDNNFYCIMQCKIVTDLLDGQYASYDFMWEVSQSEGSSYSNQASIALIDGSKCYHGDYLMDFTTIVARSVAIHNI